MNTTLAKLPYKKILIYSAISAIILLLTLRIFDNPLHTSAAPNGIVSFELAKSIEVSQSILLSWDANAKVNVGLSLGLDFLFLIAYSVFFASACFLVAQRFVITNQLIYKIGIILAKLQFAAALFDAIENIALIKLLLGSQNSIYSSIAFYFATLKFLIIAIGILYIIVGFTISLFVKKSMS